MPGVLENYVDGYQMKEADYYHQPDPEPVWEILHVMFMLIPPFFTPHIFLEHNQFHEKNLYRVMISTALVSMIFFYFICWLLDIKNTPRMPRYPPEGFYIDEKNNVLRLEYDKSKKNIKLSNGIYQKWIRLKKNNHALFMNGMLVEDMFFCYKKPIPSQCYTYIELT